ncbi:(2Fe-2S)-binding protein [bacterium]|jgi:carbon-monoxide dehydrogenase small subunit|nr:(2Fe-2S)-binding protein [bacterium]
MREITVTINGKPTSATVSPRLLLSDFLRQDIGLTGTHVGCEHGYCGSCTVHVDGASTRSCLTLAVQVAGRAVDTVESLAPDGEALHPIQQAFQDCHGLQCGFCTPGLLMSVAELAGTNPECGRAEIREHLAGNICRCTGYHQIVDAVERALVALREAQVDG